jgi:hypothetical protein
MYNEVVNTYGDRVRSHLVEVLLMDVSGKYFLPDDALIREKKVVGIFVRKNPSADVYSPDTQRPSIGDVALRSAYITLKDANKEVILNHPLADFAITDEDRSHRKLMLNSITPSKSYIIIANPGAPAGKIAVGQSILLQFLYID